jgi:hypothetical protein
MMLASMIVAVTMPRFGIVAAAGPAASPPLTAAP